MKVNNYFQTNLLWNNVNSKKGETKAKQTQNNLSINMANRKQKDSFSISSDMTEKLRRLNFEQKEITDNNSLVVQVKSNLIETQTNISKIEDLVESSQNELLTDDDREFIQKEIKHYQDDIDKIYKNEVFDKFDDAVDKLKTLTQNNENLANDEAWLNILSILSSISSNSAQSLGLRDIDVTNQNEDTIKNTLNVCKSAKQTISTQFETLTRFQDIIENADLSETQEFLTTAESLADILEYSKELALNKKANQNKLEAYQLTYLYDTIE